MSSPPNDEKLLSIGAVLSDARRPLKERFRALFTLRNVGGPVAVRCIGEALGDSSALLRHELAYCLGQMRDTRALPTLRILLADLQQEPMVRHEAAEALGAIGCSEAKDILEKYVNDPVAEVAETCQLALDRIKWVSEHSEDTDPILDSPYASVDPSPPSTETNVSVLQDILLDENKSLFERYQAMFALRNLNSKESVLALCKGLKAGSALFRHEVAFVLGQMQQEASVPYLSEVLEDQSENEMVRHECAEALGAIATSDCMDVLQRYLEDEEVVVRESCEVALDMYEYENSPEFQYADTLCKV